MAWTTFPTLTDGTVLTGAHMLIIRDNFAETAAAKATTAGRIFVATGANTLAERAISSATNNTTGTTTSTSFTATLTGGGTSPAVALTTGTQALVWVNARGSSGSAGEYGMTSFAVSGATTRAAMFEESVYFEGDANTAVRGSSCTHVTGLTAGSNTFTLQYRSSNAAATASIAYRHLVVMGL